MLRGTEKIVSDVPVRMVRWNDVGPYYQTLSAKILKPFSTKRDFSGLCISVSLSTNDNLSFH